MAVTGTGTNILHITSSTDAVTGIYVIASVRWVSTGSAAGDVCTMTDAYGNILFSSVANFTNFVDGWYLRDKWTDGIQFDAMTSGFVDVYLSPGGR